jgi:hypothetical protein
MWLDSFDKLQATATSHSLLTSAAFSAPLPTDEGSAADGVSTKPTVEGAAAAAEASTPKFIPCQAALSYFTRESLEEAIQKALDFHVRGGNLKSVQLFKDRAIDGTLEKLALQFIPEEKKEEPTKEVAACLRQHCASHCDSRGGYGRPLPGKHSQEDNKMLSSKRWFDVTEPGQGRLKWDAGTGPIGPKCSLGRLGPPGKDLDGTKFVCQEMNASSVATTADAACTGDGKFRHSHFLGGMARCCAYKTPCLPCCAFW